MDLGQLDTELVSCPPISVVLFIEFDTNWKSMLPYERVGGIIRESECECVGEIVYTSSLVTVKCLCLGLPPFARLNINGNEPETLGIFLLHRLNLVMRYTS